MITLAQKKYAIPSEHDGIAIVSIEYIRTLMVCDDVRAVYLPSEIEQDRVTIAKELRRIAQKIMDQGFPGQQSLVIELVNLAGDLEFAKK